MNKSISWTRFLNELKNLEVGKNFHQDKITTNHRNAISCAQVFLDAKYTAYKDGGRYCVHRIS